MFDLNEFLARSLRGRHARCRENSRTKGRIATPIQCNIAAHPIKLARHKTAGVLPEHDTVISLRSSSHHINIIDLNWNPVGKGKLTFGRL